jgi:hypothetical protein
MQAICAKMLFFKTFLLLCLSAFSCAAETFSKGLQLQDLPLAVELYPLGDSKVPDSSFVPLSEQ